MFDALIRDCRHALRALLRRPTYSLVVIATLTLVIGAASAVVAVVSATMVRALPFPDGDRLVQLFEMPPGRTEWADRNPFDMRVFVRLRDSLTLVEAFDGIWARDRALGGEDGEPESVTAGGVSPGVFALFGGQPAVGRRAVAGAVQAVRVPGRRGQAGAGVGHDPLDVPDEDGVVQVVGRVGGGREGHGADSGGRRVPASSPGPGRPNGRPGGIRRSGSG